MLSKTILFDRRWWLAILLLCVAAFYFLPNTKVHRGDINTVDWPYRNAGYPDTYISLIKVDLTSPDHWVSLEWEGPEADEQEKGPFHSSPGKGLGSNNCDDLIESNAGDSGCTPKGRLVVEGFSDTLPSTPSAQYVTWIDMRRAIALHYYPEVPDYPASHGCVRLDSIAAQLIHDNSIVGKTAVEIGGKWTRPVDREKLRAQLIAHEGRRSKVYTDSLGIPTIGVGFNLSRTDAKELIQSVGGNHEQLVDGVQSLSDEQIDLLLEHDLEDSIDNCRRIFPDFAELSDVRQRVLVDMMFNLGFERFQSFKKLIQAVKAKDFESAADEMVDSKWYDQVKSRAVTLVKMMRNGTDDSEPVVAAADPIIDSQMTRSEAFEGLREDCPREIREKQELVNVEYYSFDNKLHVGQIVLDRDLVEDIQIIFQIARDYHFPIGSVIPMSDLRFRISGDWDDEKSMNANNSSAFNYRATTDGGRISSHALGRAIDINPLQNPYINRDIILPRGAKYDPSLPGTLSPEHPIVQAFLELGWEWGGLWRDQKDYQHFEKPAAN